MKKIRILMIILRIIVRVLRSPRGVQRTWGWLRGKQGSMLQVEPTNLCQISCMYCIQHAGKKKGELSGKTAGATIDKEKFVSILKRHNDALYLQLQGQGEPLLHPQYGELLQIARSRGFFIQVITNGLMLTPKRCGELLTGADVITISADIATDVEMEMTRVGLKMSALGAGVKRLVHMRNELNSSVLIGVSAVLVNPNAKTEAFERFERWGVDFVTIAPLATCDGGDDRDYMQMYVPAVMRLLHQQTPALPQSSFLVSTTKALNARTVCLQTQANYIRADGTYAFCAYRHLVDRRSDLEMAEAAAIMRNGGIPAGCRGCTNLPLHCK